jgi:20S proteasome alpha/beta subunit
MIGTQIAVNRRKHQPFKHKVRYARSVTVCIAAICQENGEPRVVICSDTRLDYGDLGSTNTSCKIQLAGWGWCSQLAGGWSGANQLSSLITSRIKSLPSEPTRLDQVAEEVQKSAKRFLRSPFFDSDETYQILLSGFIQGEPQLLCLSIYGGKMDVSSRDTFGAIGSGHEIANSILSLREYERSSPLQYSVYMVYEAKRCSEKSGFVGKFTALLAQAPGSPEVNDRASVNIMGELGMENLEALYQHFWKVPFDRLISLPSLPSEFFIDPTKKPIPE